MVKKLVMDDEPGVSPQQMSNVKSALLDRQVRTAKEKWKELQSVLDIDDKEINLMAKAIEAKRTEIARIEKQIKDFRFDDEKEYANLAQKRFDFVAQLEMMTREFRALVDEARINAHGQLKGEYDALKVEATQLDVEALRQLTEAIKTIEKRYQKGARIHELDRVSKGIYGDLGPDNPSLANQRFSYQTPWKKPISSNQGAFVDDYLARFSGMKAAGGIPSEEAELLPWFSRRIW